MSDRFVIERMGAQGDGVARTERGPLHVPFTLPGETVEAAPAREGRATLLQVLQPSPQRVAPPCRHFGTCGGCALQHWAAEPYQEWKRGRVVEALAREGLDIAVDPLLPCPPAVRRRLVFSARRTAEGMLFGYNRAFSHEIVHISECPIADPALVEALPVLRRLAQSLCFVRESFRVTVTLTRSGLDVALRGAGMPDDRARRAAVDIAIASGIARLSSEGEILIEPSKPFVSFEDVAVVPPPGSFLQAVAKAEMAMAALVAVHLERAKRIVDLFAGMGSFALRLARFAPVHAVETEGAALAALDAAARAAPGLRPVTVERRDLSRRPLTAKELDRFDGLVFDPPRAGAEDQARQIARSNVRRVAAVSCNPQALARDLGILCSGGYAVTRIVPIDQFLWSSHVEAVALLEKPPLRGASRR